MNDLYQIGAVYEKDGITEKKDAKHRVGRFGYLDFYRINEPFYFQHIDYDWLGKTTRSSRVVDIEETDYGVWITTQNTIYRLDSASIKCHLNDGEEGYFD